ncbi:hypothetical protein JG687_00006237 [Phytophthora cactorum]|uniref:C2H2-type domain-containing protein n=1 Tax=Phytophthora cactorum TaxID=29920 RepID=A0A8T1UIL9_9STRA|nr:hypothetical protein JG687_00006237 [Phytophthora cactorum]
MHFGRIQTEQIKPFTEIFLNSKQRIRKELMSNTCLHVYPGFFGGPVEKNNRCTVRLTAGHPILFRGDFAHAGAGFTRFNVRLYCYVRVNGVPQDPISTETVVSRSYLCRRCMQLTYARAELIEHRQTCAMHGGRYTCQFCGQMYAIRNSFNQHVRRRHCERQDQDVLSEGSCSYSVEESTSSDDT